MFIPILLFCLGLVCLIFGGDWFVDGAVGIARKFHIPELLIGATIVSIGTTLPEVMVSSTSALQGIASISYGNAIGSIICNTSLIAALTIAIRPNEVNKKELYVPVAFFFVSMIFYSTIAYTTGVFSRVVGIILLVIFVGYITYNVILAKKAMKVEPIKDQEEIEEMPIWKSLIKLIVGAALIAVGADLLVDNGTIIAKELGVPETVIALTFVALGTSLPELITAITSLVKGHSSLSLGNIIGANLFNLVLVSGMATTLAPFNVPTEKLFMGLNASLVIDIPLALGCMLLLTLPPLFKGKLYRYQGIILLVLYASFCTFQFFF